MQFKTFSEVLNLCACSDEDTDVKALVSSWLGKQDPAARDSLTEWIGDYFYKALEWVLKQVTRSCFFRQFFTVA